SRSKITRLHQAEARHDAISKRPNRISSRSHIFVLDPGPRARLQHSFAATRSLSNTPMTASNGAGTGTPAARTAGSNSSAFPATPGRLPVYYVYSLKIRNDAEKQIEGIAWDYLFLDPNTGAELARHQFLSYAKTPPLHSATLQAQNRTPPIRVVRASAEKQAQTRPIERAEIQCVLFTDDTVWRNRYGRKGTCEFLKNSEIILKQKRTNARRG